MVGNDEELKDVDFLQVLSFLRYVVQDAHICCFACIEVLHDSQHYCNAKM